MSTPSKEYLAAYKIKNADRLKEMQVERDKRKRQAREADPVALAEYKAKRRAEYLRLRPEARTREEVAAGKRIRRVIPKGDKRECVDCHASKQIDDFPRHGVHGRKDFCIECGKLRAIASRKSSQKAYESRNREKINKTKREWEKRQPKAEKPPTFDALKLKIEGPKDRGFVKRHLDWVVIVGDIFGGGMVVKHRDGILMFLRQDGFCRYGVMGDDNGGTWIRIEKAEAVRDRLWRKSC